MQLTLAEMIVLQRPSQLESVVPDRDGIDRGGRSSRAMTRKRGLAIDMRLFAVDTPTLHVEVFYVQVICSRKLPQTIAEMVDCVVIDRAGRKAMTSAQGDTNQRCQQKEWPEHAESFTT
jgi:hypothetical protein